MSRLSLLAGMAAAVAGGAALAQGSYPVKPIRMVVAYAPGGATDIVARNLVPRMIERLGQQILVDNRPGGATLVGTDIVARASPDGYTLLMANIAFGANPSLFRKIPYDSAKAFAPVSLIVTVPTVLVVHPSLQVKSLAEFVAAAKAKPGALNYASAGNGSANHLTMEVFKAMAGVNIVHVPYKGGAPAIADTVGGQVSTMFASALVAIPHVRSGRLTALGVSGAQRNPTLAELPTIAESGLPGFDVNEWQMIIAPAGTPPAVIDRLQREAAQALAAADVRDRMAALGASPVGSTAKDAGVFLRAEFARWEKVAREGGIKPVD